MTLYLTWIIIMSVWQVVLVYLLELDDTFVRALYYLLAVPVVLATFALRIVVTNVRIQWLTPMARSLADPLALFNQILLRHVDWDRESPDFDARVFVLTETIQVRDRSHCTRSSCLPPPSAADAAVSFLWH